MKTITTLLKAVKMLVIFGALLAFAVNAPKMVKGTRAQAQQLADTQSACAQHTADANAAIDWAAGK